jgi:CheY-like chemotaxis protein
MLRKPKLNKARILIADHDRKMAEVLQKILRDIGLSNVIYVTTGRDALKFLQQEEFDMLITEWDIEPLDGINLISTLRHSEDPYFAMLPILMLTARATAEDVVMARDIGVNEFLIKPYTSKMLFNRLEHIIDFPRQFIVTETFTGPDRRRREVEPKTERRATEPETYLDMPEIKPKKGTAIKLVPQNLLRKKLGLMASLKEIITPAMLREAQSFIESMREESLSWVAEDMKQLEAAMHLILSQKDEAAIEEAKSLLLSIKSRAGTFDFILASRIAYDLYKFLRHDFVMGDMRHHLIMQKHVEGIKIMLARQVVGEGSETEHQLMEGLSLLLARLSH